MYAHRRDTDTVDGVSAGLRMHDSRSSNLENASDVSACTSKAASFAMDQLLVWLTSERTDTRALSVNLPTACLEDLQRRAGYL